MCQTNTFACQITLIDSDLTITTPGGKVCQINFVQALLCPTLSPENKRMVGSLLAVTGLTLDLPLTTLKLLAEVRNHLTSLPTQQTLNITIPSTVPEPTPEPLIERKPITYTNNRGESVTTTYSKQELLNLFEENAAEDHWLWFQLAQMAEEHRKAPGTRDMIAFLADSFLLAIGMGLRKPMIRLVFKDRRFKIYLSAKGTLCFKSGAVVPGTTDPVGDEEYMGCLWNGRFLIAKDQSRRERTLLPVEQEFMDEMNSDPVGFMSKCSKDMDRCCYCNLPLEDARSKQVGYGPVCAARWGLPWGKSYDEKVPSFAQLWATANPEDKTSIRGLCAGLRKAPKDTLGWAMLGDLLESYGWQKRPQAPEGAVRVPNA